LAPGEILRIEHDPDGVLRLVGDLDLATSDLLRTHLDAATADGGPVVVDLTGLLLIQSAGVAALYEVTPTGLRLRVSSGSAVAAVMRITGLDLVATLEYVDAEHTPPP
jgi:anti-anti-sigma factor